MPKPEPMLTPKQKFQLWEMREDGISFRDCQRWFGCSRSVLDRAMREMRVKMGRLEVVRDRKQFARTHLTRVQSQTTEA